MTGGRIRVDCVAGPPGGPVVRFAAGRDGVAVLRDAFDQLAGGEAVVAIEGLELAGLSSIEFLAAILTRHAPAAARMNSFYWSLFGGDVHAEYPGL